MLFSCSELILQRGYVHISDWSGDQSCVVLRFQTRGWASEARWGLRTVVYQKVTLGRQRAINALL